MMITLYYDSVIMLRTQISLSRNEYQGAKRAAAEQGISLAELLRRALRLVLPVSGKNQWMRYCGLVSTGNSKSSQEIDAMIYGQKD